MCLANKVLVTVMDTCPSTVHIHGLGSPGGRCWHTEREGRDQSPRMLGDPEVVIMSAEHRESLRASQVGTLPAAWLFHGSPGEMVVM